MDKENCEALLDLFLLESLRVHGYAKFTRPALDMLRGTVVQHLTALMFKLKQVAELNQRNDVSVLDLLQVMQANDCDFEELTEFLQRPGPSPDALRRQIGEVIDALTDAEESIARVGEAEVLRENDVKALTLHSATPMCFVRAGKDLEKRFVLLGPDRTQIAHTPVEPPPPITRREMKDARIEERRVFELETCKLRAFESKLDEDLNVKVAVAPEKENPLAQEAQTVDSLNEFDITNSQMFN